jgi:hypothetical protein
MSDSAECPEWWAANQRLREQMELPEYRPPRFLNEVYTHEIVPELQDRFDVELRFVGYRSRYPDDFSVEADGHTLFEIGRRRDGNGNTIYKLTSDEFRERVEDSLERTSSNGS